MDLAHPQADSGAPKFWDWLFLILLSCAIVGVAWVGWLAYQEGHKTETIKRHGEAWGEFFASHAAKRGQDDNKIEACSAQADTKNTWGDCYQALVAPGGPMDGLINPFLNIPQKLASACNPADRSLVGALVLEKLTPTPPGSPVPFVAEALTEGDAINQKLQIRITVCDKGASPIRVGDFEF
jgi:hypothetical protein